ncbi:unnamed protein product [Blepharisma stoltei]|uniref:SANT domain-containing protein n=1 Tax=Blepharisma stoltei TaxID=1481888 RepID=A0AAU9ISF4_9CILI|nr:unnamed protein product [Blepharisma stoltei]
MSTIAEQLRTETDEKVIEKYYKYWKNEGKAHLFIDFSIAYANLPALKVVIEIEGIKIFTNPYSNSNSSPVQIAKLLRNSNPKFVAVHEYILKEVKSSLPWERRKGFLWIVRLNKGKKEGIFRIPPNMLRYLAENFL